MAASLDNSEEIPNDMQENFVTPQKEGDQNIDEIVSPLNGRNLDIIGELQVTEGQIRRVVTDENGLTIEEENEEMEFETRGAKRKKARDIDSSPTGSNSSDEENKKASKKSNVPQEKRKEGIKAAKAMAINIAKKIAGRTTPDSMAEIFDEEDRVTLDNMNTLDEHKGGFEDSLNNLKSLTQGLNEVLTSKKPMEEKMRDALAFLVAASQVFIGLIRELPFSNAEVKELKTIMDTVFNLETKSIKPIADTVKNLNNQNKDNVNDMRECKSKIDSLENSTYKLRKDMNTADSEIAKIKSEIREIKEEAAKQRDWSVKKQTENFRKEDIIDELTDDRSITIVNLVQEGNQMESQKKILQAIRTDMYNISNIMEHDYQISVYKMNAEAHYLAKIVANSISKAKEIKDTCIHIKIRYSESPMGQMCRRYTAVNWTIPKRLKEARQIAETLSLLTRKNPRHPRQEKVDLIKTEYDNKFRFIHREYDRNGKKSRLIRIDREGIQKLVHHATLGTKISIYVSGSNVQQVDREVTIPQSTMVSLLWYRVNKMAQIESMSDEEQNRLKNDLKRIDPILSPETYLKPENMLYFHLSDDGQIEHNADSSPLYNQRYRSNHKLATRKNQREELPRRNLFQSDDSNQSKGQYKKKGNPQQSRVAAYIERNRDKRRQITSRQRSGSFFEDEYVEEVMEYENEAEQGGSRPTTPNSQKTVAQPPPVPQTSAPTRPPVQIPVTAPVTVPPQALTVMHLQNQQQHPVYQQQIHQGQFNSQIQYQIPNTVYQGYPAQVRYQQPTGQFQQGQIQQYAYNRDMQ